MHTAVITKIFTQGYAEVALRQEGGTLSKERYVAEVFANASQGDAVELEPASPRNDPVARVAYLVPVILLVLGVALPRGMPWGDRFLTGGVLGLLSYGMAWLMNRRARLRRRLEYHMVGKAKESSA